MSYYYPRTIQNITTAFLTIFDNIVVKKYDVNGNAIKQYDVPVRWGPIDKHRDKRTENYNETNNAYYTKLPRMSIIGPNLTYNSDRACDVNGIRYHYSEILNLNDINDFYSDPVPAPYDYNYTLQIKSNGMDYMNQILEQILPYFNPDTFIRVKEFSFLNIERDLRVLMGGGISPDFDPFDQTEDSHRTINVNIDFTVEGFMYLPISTTKIIKFIDSQYFVDDNILIDSYSTSGFEATSADEPPSDVPLDGFNFSGYSEDDDLYYYTSASN